jgi:hypothetical protein
MGGCLSPSATLNEVLLVHSFFMNSFRWVLLLPVFYFVTLAPRLFFAFDAASVIFLICNFPFRML